jgi:hypothetical protein
VLPDGAKLASPREAIAHLVNTIPASIALVPPVTPGAGCNDFTGCRVGRLPKLDGAHLGGQRQLFFITEQEYVPRTLLQPLAPQYSCGRSFSQATLF